MPPLDAGVDPYEDTGVSLLASQPPAPTKSPKEASDDWNTIYNHLETRLGAMRTWRWSWWRHWSLLAEFFSPRRWAWLVVANRTYRGSPVNDQIIDSGPLQDLRVLAGGLWTGLTNPSRPWFKLKLAIEGVVLDAQSLKWIEDAEAEVYRTFANSNFYQTMHQGFHDVSLFGTAPIIIFEDSEKIIRLYLATAGEYYLAVGSQLTVDTFYREEARTIAQIVGTYKLDDCPPQVQKLWQDGQYDTEMVVCHAIEPNFPLDRRGKVKGVVNVVPSMFVYREVSWLRGQKTPNPLSKKGFRAAPFFAMRWYTKSNEPYGMSPCMDALGDTRQIQQETRRKAEAIEKGVRPPMGADPELKNEPASILPGMITYMNTNGQKKGFWPLFEMSAQWLQFLIQDIEKVTARIKTCLFVDVFMAITQMQGVQPRNELELTKRDLERLQVLGPIVTQFETECADVAIARTLEILERRRALAPRPPQLVGISLKATYTSILRLAQQSAEAVSMKDFATVAGTTSAAAKAAGIPDPARIVNWEDYLRRYGKIVNVSNAMFFTPDQVQEHDQIRVEEQQKKQFHENVVPTTVAAAGAAKTLAQTPLSDGTALSAILGGAPGLPH